MKIVPEIPSLVKSNKQQEERKAQIGIDGKPVFKTIVAKEPDCVYIQALNLANAKKRLARITRSL